MNPEPADQPDAADAAPQTWRPRVGCLGRSLAAALLLVLLLTSLAVFLPLLARWLGFELA